MGKKKDETKMKLIGPDGNETSWMSTDEFKRKTGVIDEEKEITIRKIAYDGEIVNIVFSIGKPSAPPLVLGGSCAETPSPSFQAALNDLGKYLAELCDYPLTKEYFKAMVVDEVQLTNKKGEAATVIKGTKTLTRLDSSLSLKTPAFDAAKFPKGYIQAGDIVADMLVLINEAKEYIHGSRMQLSIFEEQEAEA